MHVAQQCMHSRQAGGDLCQSTAPNLELFYNTPDDKRDCLCPVCLFGVLLHCPLQPERDELGTLASELAMHAAGLGTQHISRERIDASVLAATRADLASATAAQMPGKPAAVLEKIVDGKLAKWCKEVRRARVASGHQPLCAAAEAAS